MADLRIEKRRALVRDVCDLLAEYIAVHDSLIRQSGFRGLFRAIDFDELATRARGVLLALDQKQIQVDAFRDTADFTEMEFAECLSQYTQSLRTAVGLLLEVVADLIAKRDGSCLAYAQQRENWRRYERAIASYQTIGVKLNTLYETARHLHPFVVES
jgi:hypothetical protein